MTIMEKDKIEEFLSVLESKEDKIAEALKKAQKNNLPVEELEQFLVKMDEEQIEEFLSLEDEKAGEFLLSVINEKKEEEKTQHHTYEEARLESFKEILYKVYILENADFGKETINYNRNYLTQIANEENKIEININDFNIVFKKPFSLGEIVKVKKVVYGTLVDDVDDITRLQKELPDFIEIRKSNVLIKDVSRLDYMSCLELFYISPVIYYSYLFFISAIGGQKKKR